MKRILIISFLFLFAFAIQAKKVELQTAQSVGLAYYYEHVNQFIPLDQKGMTVSSVYTEYENALPVYYVFNISPKGFVIVSADDNVTPVLGYSYESDFKAEALPESMQFWMGKIKKTIVDVITNNVLADVKISNAWNYYSTTTNQKLKISTSKVVAPLCSSIWDQGKYFNADCPAATGGPDGKAYAGCVATSMGQIMYYYRYPTTGQGSHNGINFASTTYNWDNMLDDLGNYNDAVALLLYHAGMSVNMSYSATGSGAMANSIPTSLKNYFKYNSTCASASYDFGYTQASWLTLVKSNLDTKHPTVYSGSTSANEGHAWVCDGYDASDNLHMNWGWSGSANGYFATTNLTAGGYSFTQGFGLAYNLYPPTTSYPSNCTGSKTLNFTTGTIEDGSGPVADYQNNNDCLWLISPTEAVAKITLSFINFSTEATNDIVTVYDGATTSAAVLATFSGSTLPANVTSTGPQMLVRFQTNGSVTGSGWKATYRPIYPIFCSGLTTLTAPTGDISDGSGTENYTYNSLCRWVIAPTDATTITLSFSSFSTAANDSLQVFDNVTNAKLAGYKGSAIPATQTYTTSKIMLLFHTDNFTNGQGFDASYTSTSSAGIDNYGLKQFSVFPNPATNQLNIQFVSENTESLNIQLTSISGQTVYSENLNNFTGSFNKSIETGTLAKGVYLLRIVGEKQAVHQKIVIE